jgi:hypothetical protein
MLTVTAAQMLTIGWAIGNYVADQKQYAAETIVAIEDPSVTTIASV